MFFIIGRRAGFKKTVDTDDCRRRRTDTTLRLRKDKKEESLAKRRAATPVAPPSAADNSTSTDGNGSLVEVQKPISTRKVYSVNDIPELMKTLHQTPPDLVSCLEAIRGFRRMLSVEKNPPVDAVLHCGVLPIMVRMLSIVDQPTLQFESAWALTNIASTDYTSAVVEAGAVSPLIALLMSSLPDAREQAAWCLGNIAGDSTNLRDSVLQAGVLEPLLKNIAEPANDSLLSNVVWSLSNLCRGKPQPDFEVIRHSIPYLATLLENSGSRNKEVLIDVCWALSYLSDGDEQRIQAVVDAGVTTTLVTLLDAALDDKVKEVSASLVNPIIRTFGNIVSGNDSQTQTVIDCGIIGRVNTLLRHSRKNVKKETCWLLSNIAAGTHSQIVSLLSVNSLLASVIDLAEKSEWEVRKEATWVISNIATGGTDDHVQFLVEFNAIRALCSMLSIPDAKMVIVALEALDKILSVGEQLNKGYVTLVDEADGIDLLERLQEHDNENVYLKTIDIIEKYFNAEDEDENLAPATDGNAFTFGVSPTKQNFNFGDLSNTGLTNQQPLQFNFANNSGF